MSTVLNERWLDLVLPDGRHLEVVSGGPDDGLPLVFQSGTPTAAVLYPPLVEAAAAQGLRTVIYSRPGYAGSTPRPGRSVADCAADVAAVVDAVGGGRFVTIGWSGGGPHALACAALLPDRCAAAATIAGVAPYGADGLDFLAGMGPENVEEFTLTLQGEPFIRPKLEELAPHFREIDGPSVAAALGGLVTEVDKASLTDEFGEYVAAGFRRAMSTGIEGWLEDGLAFCRHWGFELAQITRPIAVWQGGEDRMVPFAHGQWLAAHVPGARAHLYPEQGHLSIAVASMPRILADLVALAGGPASAEPSSAR
jgi:pimeloyl-ACP methyl ester carboxylesterase